MSTVACFVCPRPTLTSPTFPGPSVANGCCGEGTGRFARVAWIRTENLCTGHATRPPGSAVRRGTE